MAGENMVVLFIGYQMADGGWSVDGSYLGSIDVPLHDLTVVSAGYQSIIALQEQDPVDRSGVGLPFSDMRAIRHPPQPDVAAPATAGSDRRIVGE